MFFYVEFGK
jgi:hypothetical protein